MKVLVACEFSGTVRDAFRARGFDAWSCDLLPCERSPVYHIQDDVRGVLDRGWTLMIAHPPCTYLCNSGVRWLYRNGKGKVRDARRWAALEQGGKFFRELLSASIPHIAIENPIPHRYALPYTGEYTQCLQPWQFGHGETKAVCLWLRNLPPLAHTRLALERTPRVHYASPGPERWKERSRFFPGIAQAMAEQWGDYLRRIT